MNGGKTKFVSAREKRMRAQLKRERDREQAVLMAAQQQQLFGGSSGQMGGLGMGGANLFAGAGGLGSSGLLNAASNPAALQALLSSRQMLMQRQAQEMRLAEQVLAAEYSAQKQREQLRMRLAGLPDSTGSNSMLGGFSQLSGNNPVSTTGAMGGLASVEQLLAARQMGGGNGNFIDRLLAQRMGMASNSAPMDAFSSSQQRLDQSNNSRDSATGEDSKTRSPKRQADGRAGPSGQIDPELFKLYLLEQERRKAGR